MPIYDIYEHVEKQKREGGPKVELSTHISEATLRGRHKQEEEKGQLFATIAARLFFFILLITDLFWGLYTMALFFSSLALNLLSGFKIYKLKAFFARRYLNLKRSAICAIALLVSLFSPALGTMIACSYFLMYDKKGIKEVVPSVLQEQFEEFMNPHHEAT